MLSVVAAPFQDLSVFLMRETLGLFFVISGYHKLFNGARHASLLATLTADHIPLLRFNQWFVPMVEFWAGFAMVLGLATPLAALGLAVLCLTACAVDGIKRIPGMQPIDRADWLDDLLYLPEMVYVTLCLYFVAHGSGAWGLDAYILEWYHG